MANPDTAFGAFTDAGPWTVDPDGPGVAPRPGRGAPAARCLAPPPHPSPHAAAGAAGRHHGVAPGPALGLWYLQERRRGGSASIAGISRRLRVAAERLGPTYIKLGQIIASGDGIFPPELVAEFKWCRDQVPAEPWPVVERVLTEELGGPSARCSPRWTASRWPPPPSPRCTRRRCATGRRWW